MDQLSLSVIRGDPDAELDEKNEKAIRAYFRLCEDQLELRFSGRWSPISSTIRAR
jgi:hypothetical protein